MKSWCQGGRRMGEDTPMAGGTAGQDGIVSLRTSGA